MIICCCCCCWQRLIDVSHVHAVLWKICNHSIMSVPLLSTNQALDVTGHDNYQSLVPISPIAAYLHSKSDIRDFAYKTPKKKQKQNDNQHDIRH